MERVLVTLAVYGALASLTLWRPNVVVSPLPQAFGVFMIVFELTIAALILSRGTARLIGLAAGAAFLVGIVP
ncbi:MAG TPA: hypothetical protein VLO00_05365, partial [Cryobacterium sp.]|nr:hypothetical protein [Cryobacterium sp.]